MTYNEFRLKGRIWFFVTYIGLRTESYVLWFVVLTESVAVIYGLLHCITMFMAKVFSTDVFRYYLIAGHDIATYIFIAVVILLGT